MRSGYRSARLGSVTTSNIHYGDSEQTEAELRLVGDISDGTRVILLGASKPDSPVAWAKAGAKSIAVDPSPGNLDAVRDAASAAGVRVECHVGDLADLGFVPSATIDAVVADACLDMVDDLARALRQVNRVLKMNRPIIIAIPHPYGPNAAPGARMISDWFTPLTRANFRVDQILELGDSSSSLISQLANAPHTLILRARKEGD